MPGPARKQTLAAIDCSKFNGGFYWKNVLSVLDTFINTPAGISSTCCNVDGENAVIGV
jgi:hypothetical protein